MKNMNLRGLETQKRNFLVEFFSKKLNNNIYFFTSPEGDVLFRMSSCEEWENASVSWGKVTQEIEVNTFILSLAEKLTTMSGSCGFNIRKYSHLKWEDLQKSSDLESWMIVGFFMDEKTYIPVSVRDEEEVIQTLAGFTKNNKNPEYIVSCDINYFTGNKSFFVYQFDENLVNDFLRNEEETKKILSKFTNKIVNIFGDEVGNYFVKLNEGYLYCSLDTVLRSVEDFSAARSYFDVSDAVKASIGRMISIFSLSAKLGIKIRGLNTLKSYEDFDNLHMIKDQEDCYLSGFYKDQQFFPRENSWEEGWEGSSHYSWGEDWWSSLVNFISKSKCIPDLFITQDVFSGSISASVICGDVLVQYLKDADKAKKIIKNMTLIIE